MGSHRVGHDWSNLVAAAAAAEKDGHEFEQATREGDGQGSLACCSLWGFKQSDKIEFLKWIEKKKNRLNLKLLEGRNNKFRGDVGKKRVEKQ